MKLSELGIQSSAATISVNMKIMLWGATGTRKTESVLRHFPNVLVIDTEGNVRQCVGKKEIPPFLYVETKDARKIMEIVDAVARGEIKMPEGQPVQTVAIDSISVLWSVQQEVAAQLAEQRAARNNKRTDDATITQLDWVVAKRILKRLSNRLNASPIKFFFLVAREKDLYADDSSTRKIGVTPDMMKGMDYEMNLSIHMAYEDAGNGRRGAWFCEVTKVQGALGDVLPIGKRLKEFPAQQILERAGELKVTAVGTGEDEDTLASSIAAEAAASPKDQTALIQFGKELGLTPGKIGEILKANGFTQYDPAHMEAMKKVLRENIN